jgi:hypothetical protein
MAGRGRERTKKERDLQDGRIGRMKGIKKTGR